MPWIVFRITSVSANIIMLDKKKCFLNFNNVHIFKKDGWKCQELGSEICISKRPLKVFHWIQGSWQVFSHHCLHSCRKHCFHVWVAPTDLLYLKHFLQKSCTLGSPAALSTISFKKFSYLFTLTCIFSFKRHILSPVWIANPLSSSLLQHIFLDFPQCCCDEVFGECLPVNSLGNRVGTYSIA